MKQYVPQPGTIPARVVAWLAIHPGDHATAVIADALDVALESVSASIETAVRHGVIRKVKRDGKLFYSAGDGTDGQLEDEEDDGSGSMIQRVVTARPTTRWAVWSDGKVVIEQGRSRLELDGQDARRLGTFLQRALAA